MRSEEWALRAIESIGMGYRIGQTVEIPIPEGWGSADPERTVCELVVTDIDLENKTVTLESKVPGR